MGDPSSIVTLVEKYGFPVVIAVGALLIVWKLVGLGIDYVKQRMEIAKKHAEEQHEEEINRAKKYDQQMEILVTIAQQSIEAQKRGNEVIAQNTETMKNFTVVEKALTDSIEKLRETVNEKHYKEE